MLLVHGYSGAYDKVTRRVADYLRSRSGAVPKPLFGEWKEEQPPAEAQVVKPSEQVIEVLKRRGYLTQMTHAEEEAFFSKVAGKLHQMSVNTMPSYIFMPTYQCNLRCPYCFQDHMRTNPAFRHLLRIMQPEMVDRIFAALPRIEAGHGIQPGSQQARNITFFGGEPLLSESRPLIEYVMRKARELGRANFSAISNATELDAYTDLLGPEHISHIQITLDGPQREHDQRRIYPDGSGSFERIARNITLALERGTKIGVRVNVDKNNVHQLPELAEEFHRRGWEGHPGFSAYAAPINASNGKTDENSILGSWLLTKTLGEMRDQNPRMNRFGGPDDGLREKVRRIFERHENPLPSFRTEFCGAHNRMYIFDAFGDMYACWERTGDPKIRIGNIQEDGNVLTSKTQTDLWRTRTVTSNPVCRQCRFAFYCGGGCAILAEAQNGELHSNHCDGFSKRFRASAAEAYAAHASGAESVGNSDRVCDL
ncbi:radical SAM/SPASM domain-containing protein [Myxococcus qinghaiensis]|uniref:radical SAM/SPASM domain-containing protein n=1 Tax=Myxococcus qinghaiensis TaxID=2906758 RepID=UPI0020A70E61|nr:radical SAM protein [Myxococcus qinghaiensis]MCP3166848.1 radical SAM protein [Myxococcus qinghaiensis]